VQDAPRREESLRRLLQPVGASAHDDDLEAAVGVEVNVHRRPNLVAELVLHLGDALGELAHVVIVNDGGACEGVDPPRRERPNDVGASEIPQCLGASAAPLADELVELRQERRLHRHTEAYEGHAARELTTGLRSAPDGL
jgi:hypothetical protein